MKIPNDVKQYTSSARYYLSAADNFPSPTKEAAKILLLTVGWENIIIADQKMHGWAASKNVDDKLLKSHEAKLDEVDKNGSVLRVILGPPGNGVHAREVNYTTGADFKKLREICQYGLSTETHDVAKLFHRGWFSDDFRRTLENKIKWTEMFIEIYESLE